MRTWAPYSPPLPAEMLVVALVFIFAALFLGEMRSYYERIWWWDIALPSVRPTVGAFTLMSFTGTWNSFLWPLVTMGVVTVGLLLFGVGDRPLALLMFAAAALVTTATLGARAGQSATPAAPATSPRNQSTTRCSSSVAAGSDGCDGCAPCRVLRSRSSGDV